MSDTMMQMTTVLNKQLNTLVSDSSAGLGECAGLDGGELT